MKKIISILFAVAMLQGFAALADDCWNNPYSPECSGQCGADPYSNDCQSACMSNPSFPWCVPTGGGGAGDCSINPNQPYCQDNQCIVNPSLPWCRP